MCEDHPLQWCHRRFALDPARGEADTCASPASVSRRRGKNWKRCPPLARRRLPSLRLCFAAHRRERRGGRHAPVSASAGGRSPDERRRPSRHAMQLRSQPARRLRRGAPHRRAGVAALESPSGHQRGTLDGGDRLASAVVIWQAPASRSSCSRSVSWTSLSRVIKPGSAQMRSERGRNSTR